jgi:phosphohistidine phosphatase
MRYMLLMRHANAAFPDPGMTDYDRPLTEVGRLEAARAAAKLLDSGLLPDKVYCSPARRAAETLALVSEVVGLDRGIVTEMGELYSGDPATYLETVHSAAEDRVTLLVGHNPMLEDCALALADDGNEEDIARLRNGFPTGAIAVVRLTGMNGATKGFLERVIATH